MAQRCHRPLVQAVGHAQSEAPGCAVGEAAQRAPAGHDRRELAGRCGGLEVHTQARCPRGLGEVPAERGRGGRQQEQIRTGVHRVGETLAQFGDERRSGAHQFTSARDTASPPGVGGETAEFQPGMAHQGSERVRGGQGDVVPCTAQLGAQARVGRDITARSGRGDQYPHRSSSEWVRPPARRAALAWTALHM